MTMRTWLAEPLSRDVAQALERLRGARGVQHVAVMPDVHLADKVCVGTVVGTDGWLYPQAVGGDIGCGMAAVALDGDRAQLDEATLARLLRALQQQVPAVRQRHAQSDVLGELSDPALQREVARDARVEFGTLGRGNHFLELQQDEHGGPWLMVHSGSRAVGPAVQAHHLARGERIGAGLLAVAADTDAGRAYVHDVAAALRFAEDNRRAIARGGERALAEVGIAVRWPTWFDCTHNFVRRERHGDADLWVHRKGACSAQPGERAIVPGSMGTRSFHVEGRGESAALCSCSHGAGRRLPRGEAMRALRARDVEQQMRGVFFDRAAAAALRDEAPAAYKDIGAVMRAQRDLVRIVRTLTPVLAFKGT
jgi:tRNA-splicing ligase RtcB